MKDIRRIMLLCFVGMLAVGSVSGSIILPGTWQGPTNGYACVYNATNGLLPEASTPAWAGTYDSAGGGASETMTAGGTILSLVNSATTGPIYTLSTGAGQGTATGSMTVDLRLKLGETGATNNYEFSLFINRPTTVAQQLGGKTNVQYYFRFGDNAASYLKLGNDWHDMRILIDADTQTASLYLDGSSTAETGFPANTISITTLATTLNSVKFGDGGTTGGIGSVDIAYIAWTNNELASVIPEPATVGLLAMGFVAAFGLRKKLNL